MFDADRPIFKHEQDRLNRSIFSKYLARCLLDHHDIESLVVGIYGKWGVGKTSIINLMIEELNFAASNLDDEAKPIILNFSAWSYAGQGQLIYSFFRRLSSALRSVDYLENSNRIIHLLELYVSFFTKQAVPKSLRTKRSWWQIMTQKGKEEVYAWESGRDLTLVKAELNELLSKQKHKIIIIIDNISRLYPEEVKQIFQIVKSMGDYCNTAYVLAFDKNQVIDAINRVDGQGGEDFLEKVVQLPFEIPPILSQDLENILADRLNEVLLTVPKETWRADYWATIYYSGLKYFFVNVRDITRYVNILNFSYMRLRDLVNPIDFFALTALEVFMPNIYYGIRDNKDLFTDLLDQVYILNRDELNKDKMRCDEILSRDNRLPREIVLSLLMEIFPRLRRIYQPDVLIYHSDAAARKLRRACSPDLFDIYFRLSMQVGQLAEPEFKMILGMAKDTQAFDQALTRLNQDNRIIVFLDKLDSKVIDAIPINDIQAIVSALIDNGDLFPPGNNRMLSLDTPQRLHRIIHALLNRFKESTARFIILQTAIANSTKSIYTSVYEIWEQSNEHGEESDTFLPLEFRDLMPEELFSLQKLTASRIENWAKTNRLITHPKLLFILFAWQRWGDENQCSEFVAEMTATDRGLLTFLTITLDKAINQAMTHYEKNHDWASYLEDIETFIPLTTIESRASAIFQDPYFEKLTEREQLALMIFLDLMKSNSVKIIPSTV